MVQGDKLFSDRIVGIAMVISGLNALVFLPTLASIFSFSLWQPHSEQILDYYFLKPEEFLSKNFAFFSGFLLISYLVFGGTAIVNSGTRKGLFLIRVFVSIIKKSGPFILAFIGVAFWIIMKNGENIIVFIPSFMLMFTGLMLLTHIKNLWGKILGLLYLGLSVYSFFNEERILLYFLICFGFLNLLFGIYLIFKKYLSTLYSKD